MIRRRIASDTAHSWARHLRLNNTGELPRQPA